MRSSTPIVLFALASLLNGQGINVSVPGASQIGLAGQPDGTTWNSDSAPLNSPVQVRVSFSAGQGFQFTAAGQVGIYGDRPFVTPDGTLQCCYPDQTGGGYGIGRIRAPAGSLIGVFTADQVDRNTNQPSVDYHGAAQDVVVVAPLLQQPFLIGSGQTSEGKPKTFVAPARATRLFLGITASDVSRNSGSFDVTASLAPVPALAGNPVRVLGTAQLTLSGQAPGATWNDDTAPPNSPVQVLVPVSAGQAFTISATGLVGLSGDRPSVTPDGTLRCCYPIETGGGADIASILAPAGSLVAVFLGDQLDRNTNPPGVDYRGAAFDLEIVAPLLQQPFLVGAGLTSEGKPRVYVAPARASRLFLAITAFSHVNNSGHFDVTVSSVPARLPSGNPVRVLGTAQLGLSGQPSGAVWNRDTAPPNAPAQAVVPLVAGQGVKITATGLVGLAGDQPWITPDGTTNCCYPDSTGGNGGIASIRAAAGSLIGVFLPEQLDANAKPPGVDFTGGSKDAARLSPLLQQPFLIGTGKTSDGTMKTFVVPARATRLFLGVTGSSTSGNTGSFLVTVTPDGPLTPILPQVGTVNALTFGSAPFSPGSVISVYGSNLGQTTAVAADVPLPIQLAGVQLFFDTTPAPLFLVSPNQINAQIPFELNKDRVQVTVSRGGAASLPITVALTPYRPVLVTLDGRFALAWNTTTGDLVSPSAPAVNGSDLAVYTTGLGPVSPPVPSGAPAPNDSLSSVTSAPSVIVAGAEVQPTFAGLAPGLIGVYQVNFTLPSGAPTGIATLQVKIGGATSNIAQIPIRQ
ncbi:MAG: hypothetical protein HYR60_20855 [Acidobacteria bacterium]|nr:hypothetical protein [Acidobacteriota bacterium]